MQKSKSPFFFSKNIILKIFSLIFLSFFITGIFSLNLVKGYDIIIVGANTSTPTYSDYATNYSDDSNSTIAFGWTGDNNILDNFAVKLKMSGASTGTTGVFQALVTNSTGWTLAFSDNQYHVTDLSTSGYTTITFTFHNSDINLTSGLTFYFGVGFIVPNDVHNYLYFAYKSTGAGTTAVFRTYFYSNGTFTSATNTFLWNIAYTRNGTYAEVTKVNQAYLGVWLTGGRWTNMWSTPAFAPTEIPLQQGKLYTMKVNVYNNSMFYTGGGNYSIGNTPLTKTYTTMTNYTEDNFIYSISGNITETGTFNWTLPTGINVNVPCYEQYRILVHLNNGDIFNFTYYFGWYGIKQSGNSGTPYPKDGGGVNDGTYTNPTPNNGDTGETSKNALITIFSDWRNLALIIIYALCCGVCTYLFSFTGLIAGFNIATVICFITGLLGGLMYPVIGLVIIADVALIITGSGLLNKRGNGEQA